MQKKWQVALVVGLVAAAGILLVLDGRWHFIGPISLVDPFVR